MFGHDDPGDENNVPGWLPDWFFPWVIPIGFTLFGIGIALMAWAGLLR